MKLLLLRSTLLLLLCGSAHAAVTFNVHSSTVNTPAEGSRNAPQNSNRDMQVVLGDSYMRVQTGQQVQIFDFARRRRYEIDLASNSYVDYSLYDAVGFRDMELRNRIVLARALAAAAVDKAKTNSLQDDEQVLSVTLPAAAASDLHTEVRAGLRTETIDGTVRYSLNGSELLRTATTGTQLAAPDAARFAQFLRYMVGGHPLALQKVQQQASLPAMLTYRFKQIWGDAVQTLNITGVAQAGTDVASAYDLGGASKRNSATSELDQLLDAASGGNLFGAKALKARLTTQRQQAFTEQRPIDAMLMTTELILINGEPPVPYTPEQLALLRGSEELRRMGAAIKATSKAELPAAIATLQQMQSQTTRPHVLKVYEANLHIKQGDFKTAIRLFLEALRANPQMASAYKDLGDVMLLSYDMPHAWRCWDIGRHMAPGFANFGPVNQFEATLARNYPDYF